MLQVGYRRSGMPWKPLVFHPRYNGTEGTLKQRKCKNGLCDIGAIPKGG